MNSVNGDNQRPRRVFVSYAHESESHKDYVLRFCRLLRRQGIDAWLDQYDCDERRDWYVWMTAQIRRADYVCVVASLQYKKAGDGDVDGHYSRGVQSEAALLRDLLHADRPTWTRRILPVILPGGSVGHLPLFLQPYCADHYVVSELTASGIESLLRAMMGQPSQLPPDLGPVPLLPPAQAAASSGAAAGPTGTVEMHGHANDHGRVTMAGHDVHIHISET